MSIIMKISVIIPVLNESQNIAQTLTPLLDIPDVEIIIVDGGSTDNTLNILDFYPVKVISTKKGRSHQMNSGSNIAEGDILLFLHGDTILPLGWAELIKQTLLYYPHPPTNSPTGEGEKFVNPHPPTNSPTGEGENCVIAGAFQLKIDSNLSGLRFIEIMVKVRSHLLSLPYGDQGIFMRKTTFEQLGGFPEIPIMEDVELILKLKRLGQIKILSECVITSPRRWEKLGVIKTTVINQLIMIGYFGGISPEKLAFWYRNKA